MRFTARRSDVTIPEGAEVPKSRPLTPALSPEYRGEGGLRLTF
jgi:hypothetical protein